MKKISDLEKARDLLRKIEQSSRVPRKLRYEIGKFLRGDRERGPRYERGTSPQIGRTPEDSP